MEVVILIQHKILITSWWEKEGQLDRRINNHILAVKGLSMSNCLFFLLNLQTDAHYSLILLLLTLADSPTNVDYEPPQSQQSSGMGKVFAWCLLLAE